MPAATATVTKITGSGAGASTYYGVWDLLIDGGGTTISKTIQLSGGAASPNMDFTNLLPQAGGGTVSTVVTNATPAQALKVTIVPITLGAANPFWWDIGSSSLTDPAAMILSIATGTCLTGDSCRIIVERASTYGY